MAADLSAFVFLAPVMAFLLVFVVVFAVLLKLKILGEHKWGLVFISFIIATLFISFAGAKDYVLVVAPWFAVLLVSLFFLLVIIGFVGEKASFLHKGIGIGFVIVAVLVFVISGIVVFSDFVYPYLPGSIEAEFNPITSFLYSSRVWGAAILLGISAIVSWVLVKAKVDKK